MEAVAKLNNYPTSPRKMRLLADLIRGMEVEKALGILQFNPKHPAVPMYKLLKSAINNWEQKNAEARVEDADLFIKTIMVDGGRVIKRMRPAPQGRGYRIIKRSNHVTIIVDSKYGQELPGMDEVTEDPEEKKSAPAKKDTSKKAAPEKKAKKATPKKEAKEAAPEKAEKESPAKEAAPKKEEKAKAVKEDAPKKASNPSADEKSGEEKTNKK